jgi:hypothetical protein
MELLLHIAVPPTADVDRFTHANARDFQADLPDWAICMAQVGQLYERNMTISP